MVMPRSAFEGVGARAAVQNVVACAAHKRIQTAFPQEDIAPSPGLERVVAFTTEEHVERAAFSLKCVVALFAVDQIAVSAPRERVIAPAAENLVHTAATLNRVVA